VVKVLPPELGSYFNRMGSDVHLGLSVDVAEEVTKESRGVGGVPPSLFPLIMEPSLGVFGVVVHWCCFCVHVLSKFI